MVTYKNVQISTRAQILVTGTDMDWAMTVCIVRMLVCKLFFNWF